MSDIVERLLAWRTAQYPMGDDMHREAADTITALRAENERLGKDYQTARDAHDSLLDKIERLNKSRNKWGQKYNKLLEIHKGTKNELANQIQWVKDLADNLIAEEAKTTALRAENERLRAALIVWQNAYKTGRNEPLVQAYEHSISLEEKA